MLVAWATQFTVFCYSSPSWIRPWSCATSKSRSSVSFSFLLTPSLRTCPLDPEAKIYDVRLKSILKPPCWKDLVERTHENKAGGLRSASCFSPSCWSVPSPSARHVSESAFRRSQSQPSSCPLWYQVEQRWAIPTRPYPNFKLINKKKCV